MLVPIISKIEPTLVLIPNFTEFPKLYRIHHKKNYKSRGFILDIKKGKIKNIYFYGKHPLKKGDQSICLPEEIKSMYVSFNNFLDVVKYVRQELCFWNLNVLLSRKKVQQFLDEIILIEEIPYPIVPEYSKYLTEDERFYFIDSFGLF